MSDLADLGGKNSDFVFPGFFLREIDVVACRTTNRGFRGSWAVSEGEILGGWVGVSRTVSEISLQPLDSACNSAKLKTFQ